MLDSARHIDVLSEDRHMLKPHRWFVLEIAGHIDALSEDSCILKPNRLSDVG
ncbi:unnamed protein product [Ectocarpus sp. CCAP 1310/34]|nr:unnamed protein product [Ectocarpus sp. CCAP 1310/34]